MSTDDPLSEYLVFFAFRPDACAYIKGKTNQSLGAIFTPATKVAARKAIADALFEDGFGYACGKGFIRAGCALCNACKMVRYPVADFRPSKSQIESMERMPGRRVMNYRALTSARFFNEHARLMRRYHTARFPRGSMAAEPARRLRADFNDTAILPAAMLELRLPDGRLVGASIYADTGYNFYGIHYYYDPALAHLEPGKQLMFSLLDHARRIGRTYLYVGPWVAGNKNLATKTLFRPYELLHDDQWLRFDKAAPALP